MAVESQHPVDPLAIAGAGIETLVENTVVSNLVTREGLDQWRGRPGMSVETVVPGVLPYREYKWKNDRSAPIVTDDYSETIVSTKIGFERMYSAVKWSDEDEFDFRGEFGRVFNAQIDAVSRAPEDSLLSTIKNAPYEVVINIDQSEMKAEMELGRDIFHNAFVDAKGAISRMRVPYSQMVAVVADDFADVLEKHQKLTLNQGRGDGALGRAYFGSINGIDLVRASWVPSGIAYLFDKTAFVLRTATPKVPRSVPFGATASGNGYVLSWMMDYDPGHLEDRSVFQAYLGSSCTFDKGAQYAPWLVDNADDDFFVRGIVIGLDGAVTERRPGDGNTDVPGGNPDSVLAKVYNKTLVTPGLATEGGEPWPAYLAHPAPAAPAEDPVEPTP